MTASPIIGFMVVCDMLDPRLDPQDAELRKRHFARSWMNKKTNLTSRLPGCEKLQ